MIAYVYARYSSATYHSCVLQIGEGKESVVYEALGLGPVAVWLVKQLRDEWGKLRRQLASLQLIRHAVDGERLLAFFSPAQPMLPGGYPAALS